MRVVRQVPAFSSIPRARPLATVHEAGVAQYTHDTRVSAIPYPTVFRPTPPHLRQEEEARSRRGKDRTSRSLCRVCRVSCIFILLTNLIFIIIIGIIVFNGGLDLLTLP